MREEFDAVIYVFRRSCPQIQLLTIVVVETMSVGRRRGPGGGSSINEVLRKMQINQICQ